MIKNYKELRDRINKDAPPIVSVAVAHNREVIKTVKAILEDKLARFILFGDKEKILKYIEEEEISSSIFIEHIASEEEATDAAVKSVKSGQANMLMKGMVNSSTFLKSVILGEKAEGNKCFLSHLASFQIPGFNRLLFFSDGGMNVAPNLEEKMLITRNAILGLHKLGIHEPKVAVLAANENIDYKIPASAHGAELAKMWREGDFPSSLIEGPISLDVALSKEVARLKSIDSTIAGETNLFIMPDIQAGNIVGKTLIHCAKAKMAGVVLGASYPIVMTSRAEDATGKENSIALAAAMAGAGGSSHVI